MGLSFREFMATPSGRIEKVSFAKIQRIWFKNERWPEVAGQELKMLNVMVEVDHRKVLRVLRALPTRWRVDANGDIDRRWAQHRAAARVDAYIQRRLNRPTTTDAEIARLEADANYFWEPTESEWNQVADLLGVPVADLKASQHRPV
jgi:hypothetical protein